MDKFQFKIKSTTDSPLSSSPISPLKEKKSRRRRKPSWNDKSEDLVRDICKECKIYKRLHTTVSLDSQKTHSRIMYSALLLGPLIGMFTSIELAVGKIVLYNVPILDIASCFLSFVSASVLSVAKFGKFDDVSAAHKLAAAKYASLQANARRMLSMDRINRIDASAYLEWLTLEFEECLLSSPSISINVDDNDDPPVVSSTHKPAAVAQPSDSVV